MCHKTDDFFTQIFAEKKLKKNFFGPLKMFHNCSPQTIFTVKNISEKNLLLKFNIKPPLKIPM